MAGDRATTTTRNGITEAMWSERYFSDALRHAWMLRVDRNAPIGRAGSEFYTAWELRLYPRADAVWSQSARATGVHQITFAQGMAKHHKDGWWFTGARGIAPTWSTAWDVNLSELAVPADALRTMGIPNYLLFEQMMAKIAKKYPDLGIRMANALRSNPVPGPEWFEKYRLNDGTRAGIIGGRDAPAGRRDRRKPGYDGRVLDLMWVDMATARKRPLRISGEGEFADMWILSDSGFNIEFQKIEVMRYSPDQFGFAGKAPYFTVVVNRMSDSDLRKIGIRGKMVLDAMLVRWKELKGRIY